MNYLAHAYLSFDIPDILIGNMISDFVKGRHKFDYPPPVQKGIALHRAIDEFTDNHPSTKEAKKVFQPDFGKYSSVFMDVVYDHFLAKDREIFPDSSLQDFALNVYSTLDVHENTYPETFRMLFPYMKQYNWLYNYSHRSGIERSFNGIFNRALYIKRSGRAFELFETHYETLEGHYRIFFPELQAFSFSFLQSLMDSE